MSKSDSKSDSDRWSAVVRRDKSSHSKFIYAVLTTRIFCRPTCPARLARRANVVFFDNGYDAEKAGFRPCRRCKPTEQDDEHELGGSSRLVSQACQLVNDKGGEVSVGEMAEYVGISTRHLYGLFKKGVGCSPAVYAARARARSQDMGFPQGQVNTQTNDDTESQYVTDLAAFDSQFPFREANPWFWDSITDATSPEENDTALLTPSSFVDDPTNVHLFEEDWHQFLDSDLKNTAVDLPCEMSRSQQSDCGFTIRNFEAIPLLP